MMKSATITNTTMAGPRRALSACLIESRAKHAGPATQCAHERATRFTRSRGDAEPLTNLRVSASPREMFIGALPRAYWVAGSSPAMVGA